MVQLALELRAYSFRSVTMACASADRPSPTGPTFSAVLNFTDTRSTSSPSVSARRSRMVVPEVLQLGTLQNDRWNPR